MCCLYSLFADEGEVRDEPREVQTTAHEGD